MSHTHYTPPRAAQARPRTDEAAEARAFLSRPKVEPQSHRRVLRSQLES